jgi:transcription antitermination factor NusG
VPLNSNDKFQEPPKLSESAKWFCVMTNPGCERRASHGLYAAGYRTFYPKVRKWATHARVKKATEKPLLGRYVFVEVDHPRQSHGTVRNVDGVELILSGVLPDGTWGPLPFPANCVSDLRLRYMAGEWDEIARGPLPVGARIKIVEGEFDNLLATVTGRKGHRIDFKLFEQNRYGRLNDCSVRAA